MMDKNYTLITGASSGIGEACALALAKEGRPLILLARRGPKLESIKLKLESQYKVSVLIYTVDLGDLEQIDDFF